MDQRDSGALPGIHGRLGDLGAIDEKYDVAISTACGALDHIIVDSMDTAIKCVEFLKKRNVGLATFIGLDKVRLQVAYELIITIHRNMYMYIHTHVHAQWYIERSV